MSGVCDTILHEMVLERMYMMNFALGFNLMVFLPDIAIYLVLSLLSLGVIFFFKKKSDQELRELEEKGQSNIKQP
ncbi:MULTISPECIES: hypothetical protein [unclassified Bacillus (in: firmicutes)]|uniref:hypothetical protein n=1 Tax=unclassified Bacillus (in: firmicutes) TaxID=185979 RepID=UPI000B832307|nr:MULTISPECIES: hypothetical protein [unclassified Bacillus (in: firmicutes)]